MSTVPSATWQAPSVSCSPLWRASAAGTGNRSAPVIQTCPRSRPSSTATRSSCTSPPSATRSFESGVAVLAPFGSATAFDDDALLEAHTRVAQLLAALSEQCRRLAIERARRLIAANAPGITELQLLPHPDSEEVAFVAVNDAYEPVDLAAVMSAELLQELGGLVAEVDPAEARGIRIVAESHGPAADFPELPSTAHVVAKRQRERPARQGKRRIRWQIADLVRVEELADAERAALARLVEENGDDHDDAIAALERISETARRLVAARQRPHSRRDSATPAEVQVAYLAPLEVLVDLAAREVTAVAVIDEAIELDVEEGARERDAVTPVSAVKARAAIAIAELSDGGEWPAATFGW